MSAPDLLSLPGLPKDASGPTFAEPWEAQAFALAVRLNTQGTFAWSDWAAALSRELMRDPADDGSDYFLHWVSALEILATECGLVTVAELVTRKDAWVEAYRHTPHGHPVELQAK